MAYRYGGESIVALQILRILRILPQLSSGVVFTPPFQPLVVRSRAPEAGRVSDSWYGASLIRTTQVPVPFVASHNVDNIDVFFSGDA